MSANRKLQSEVDKVLKKIEEGVEVFDDIWDKVYAANQQSQKEKYESDLKKEIKKLQRLRDQVKTWQGNNDIKDKTALIDAKKLIESKMEQFKVCEKEMKTKAFSKEGLAREEKLDPSEIEKEKTRSWVQSIIEKIENFVESWEADIERISNAKGKNKSKEQLLRLDTKVSKSRWHITTLDQINRLIDNDSLEVELLNDIKDDIEYFVECMENDDCDGIDDDYNIYEDLNLDSLTGRCKGSQSVEKDNDPEISTSSSSSSSSSSKPSATVTTLGNVGGIAIGKKALPSTSSTASIVASISPAKATKATKGAKSNTKQVTNATAPSPEASTSAWAKPSGVASKTPASTTPVTKIVNDNVSDEAAPSVAKNKSEKLPVASNSTAPAPIKQVVENNSTSKNNASNGQVHNGESVPRTNPSSSINTVVGRSSNAPSNDQEQKSAQITPTIQPFSSQQSTAISQQPPPSSDSSSTSDTNAGKSQFSQFGNSQEMQNTSNLLKVSMMHSPPVMDSIADHRQKGFTPKNPYNVHPSFPTQVPSIFENPAIFERLSMDSLFLAFYYQQGSYQQYLAAKQLKKNSWRFHKKYMTWFQRHEEPKVTTDEYEEGTYVYFDYESGWCQRIKSEFTFEYCFLEDELNQPKNA